MAYGDFKDLTKRTVADKVLPDKVFNVAKIQIRWISKQTCFNGLQISW